MNARGRSLVYALAAVFSAALIAFAAHAVKNRKPQGRATTPAVAVAAAGVRIGEPVSVEELTLFPIFSAEQQDPGPITTLASALSSGAAEVREVGAGESQAGLDARRHQRASGPVVNTLVIANGGDTPIYVLGGTVVKGGNQDRQIAQDFVVAAKSTVPVDAFCVEQGRWTGEREGVGTQGKFVAVDQLAASKVRAAGQYESSQGEVWAEVAKVNSAHGKSKASGTLMATLDDAEVKSRREGLAKRILSALAKSEPPEELVGMAYAVNGQVRGVRWFSSHRLFELFQGTLANTAASDALTARGGAAPQGAPPMTASDVGRFMREIDQAKAEDKATQAGNVNSYKKAKAGYGSSTTYKPAPAATAVPLSSDYVAK